LEEHSKKISSVRPVQSEKAEMPMLVTLEGIVTAVRPVQFKKAQKPMLVTLWPRAACQTLPFGAVRLKALQKNLSME